ncbi:arrestin [Coniochaeta sp. 2T2.1]|nr:arrestin [Coniochaeta sp. 2T2.1]
MGTFSNNNSVKSTPLEDSSSTSRSFFSRFSLPIRSRARNLTDFHIRPADPHRRYSAGDHVTGAVVLTVLKPIRITHLTVSLHGYVRVHKAPNGGVNEAPVVPATVASQSGSKFKYFGNGFATLFEDEQVLSADGRLEAGRYEFNFDLMFPGQGLPSSIDFERGTIAYMITATLTRPTSLSPTTSCERKIYLVEKIDVGLLTPPRARTIYLEPIPRRSRKKKTPSTLERVGSVTSDKPEPASDMDSTRVNESHIHGSTVLPIAEEGTHDQPPNPRSPIQSHSDMHSEISGESTSTSTGPSGSGDRYQKRDSGSQVTGGTRKSGVEDRTITTNIELLKGGCLPGDLVSVKISVQHIKRIKSMHGVIVTLYRQGRIDSSPPISLFKGHVSEEEARRLQREEYYPKSKTGLGGLSLTSAGSCSVFRKDLSQTFSPLIIDPVTLTASVTTSVRIPEDAFPTIKGVPGEMITFKYQLEVIVDLGGKLASQIQSSQSAPGLPPTAPLVGNPYEAGATSLASYGGRPIDTDRLRREKGVIAVAFEVVVGTDDSSRQRGKSVMRGTPSIYTQQYQEQPSPFEPPTDQKSVVREGYDNQDYDPGTYAHAHDEYPSAEGDPTTYSSDNSPRPPDPSAPFYVPPPQIPEENGLSEKERIRQAEQRLLPSQPDAGPSSPSYPHGENIYDAEDEPQAGSSSQPPPPLPPAHDAAPPPPPSHEGPSAPTLDDIDAPTTSADDKHELERQRLLAEASAPPEFPEDYDAAGPSNSASVPSAPAVAFEPSAPVLADEEHYGPHHSYQESGPSAPGVQTEELPRYER